MGPKEGNISNGLVIENISKTNKGYYILKRIFDILFGLIGTLLCIPLAIIIKICYMTQKDFKSILFTQERIGLNGKIIKILKFRSMVPNAEEVLEKLMEEDSKIKEEYETNKKLANDPRITKIGRLIRISSIDEFPQFINVLLGSMSVVGPRPYLPREKKDMDGLYDTIITCKPGITGLWQVSGRNDVSFKYRLKMDKMYIIKRNTKLDIKIIFKTIGAVMVKKGAK